MGKLFEACKTEDFGLAIREMCYSYSETVMTSLFLYVVRRIRLATIYRMEIQRTCSSLASDHVRCATNGHAFE